MSELHVAGGVYAEVCDVPLWNSIYGSGGRAAEAAAGVVDQVHLHTYVAPEFEGDVQGLADRAGFELHPTTGVPVLFHYLHPLSTPRIQPRRSEIAQQPPLSVSGPVVARFGMMEGDAVVHAERAVYDPQSPVEPRWFADNGSTAGTLAMVINAYELRLLCGEPDLDSAAEIAFGNGVDVLVVKMGSKGAMVRTPASSTPIPVYETPAVWKIGSGDVFTSAFAAFWGCQSMDPVRAADLASRATAFYSDKRSLPFPTEADLSSLQYRPSTPKFRKVYLAGPFFTLAQRWMIEEVRHRLRQAGVAVFSPLHDVGRGAASKVVAADLLGLDESECVLALVDGLDSGTLFEVGYAAKAGKRIVALAENVQEEDLKMLRGSGCVVVDDLSTAIYTAVWNS